MMSGRSAGEVVLAPVEHDGGVGALTCSRLLQERMLRDSVVLHGVDGLGAHVAWVRPVLDALDDPEDRLDGVLVVGAEGQFTDKAVLELSRRGVAGLLVRGWTRERWEDQHAPTGLPVIGIPAHARNDAVAQQAARLSYAYESHVLRYARDVHSALATLMHRGSGVDALCDLIERTSGCAVAVVDAHSQMLACAQTQHGWIDPTSMGKASRDVVHLLATHPTGQAAIHEPFVTRGEVKGRTVTLIVGTIEVADTLEGWVVLIDDAEAPGAHQIAEHRVVVEQAGPIVGTELLRVRSVERAEERARGNFVHALLHGRFSNHADLVARAAHHDFPIDSRFGVCVVLARGLIADGDSPHRLAAMAREASRVQGTPDRRTMAAVVGDVIAVIREVAPAPRSGTDQGARELAQFAAALSRRLQTHTQWPLHTSYGRPCVGANAIVGAYREARIALGLSGQLGLSSPSAYGDLRVYSALLGLAQEAEGRAISAEFLDPLRAASGDLVEAARAYVQAGGNLNQAARDLAVHRNTMLYKIERVSKALDWDLREPEAQFALWLALKLDMLADTADDVNRTLDAG